jgi:hypothetical protein
LFKLKSIEVRLALPMASSDLAKQIESLSIRNIANTISAIVAILVLIPNKGCLVGLLILTHRFPSRFKLIPNRMALHGRQPLAAGSA